VPLRVLSLNLWHHEGPWARRRARIREWIDRLDPDVIGFQEVLRGEAFDQLAELLGGLERHVAFARASDFWADPRLAFGNAVVSRWPLEQRAVLPLPDAGDGETRCALSVTLRAPFGPVLFTCTHLNWRLHHGHVRERQAAALADFVLTRRPRRGFPPVVVGDLNAEPDSTEIRYLVGLHSLAGRSVHFRDAWRIAGDGGAGFTWSRRNPYTRPSLEPERRIDYVLAGYPQPDGLGVIDACRVVCDDERDGVWPSDHFGVYAELRSEPTPGERTPASPDA
jgi:endonuclease/exonuclease/phosphatase family metal-dependent hydrolase